MARQDEYHGKEPHGERQSHQQELQAAVSALATVLRDGKPTWARKALRRAQKRAQAQAQQ